MYHAWPIHKTAAALWIRQYHFIIRRNDLSRDSTSETPDDFPYSAKRLTFSIRLGSIQIDAEKKRKNKPLH